jgi:hypothetical protein
LIGWNWLKLGNLIHAIQGLYYDVEVLDEETDVARLTLPWEQSPIRPW